MHQYRIMYKIKLLEDKLFKAIIINVTIYTIASIHTYMYNHAYYKHI